MLHPLTPPDCNLHDFEFMPLDVQRLFNSDFWMEATADQKVAAIELWGRAWHQTPAGSVPNKDVLLAALSGAREKWPEVRDLVLRGWVDGGDGRLYHPVVCAKALEAWLEKLATRVSSGHGNAKRWNGSFDDTHLHEQIAIAKPLLFALNPLSKVFSRKRTAVIEKGETVKKAGKPAKPKVPKAAPAAASADRIPAGEGQDAGEIARDSKGTETVKGQREIVGGVPPTPPSADALDGGTPDGMPPAPPPPIATPAPTPSPTPTPAPTRRPAIAMADRALVLPDWLQPHAEAWRQFEENRWAKHGRAPYTAAAQKGILTKLDQLRGAGQDINDVLMASVRNSWTDVFAQKSSQGARPAGAGRYAGGAAAIFPSASSSKGDVVDV